MHEGSEEGEEKMGLRGRTKCSACFSKAKSDRTLSRATLGSRIPSRQKITTCPQKRIKKGGGIGLRKGKLELKLSGLYDLISDTYLGNPGSWVKDAVVQ